MATYAITYTSEGLRVNDRIFPEPVLSIIPKTIINDPVLEIQSNDLRMGIVLTDTVTVAGSPGAGTLTGLKAQIQAIIPTLADLSQTTTALAKVATNAALLATAIPAKVTLYQVTLDSNTGAKGWYFKDTDGDLYWIAATKIN